MFGPIKRGIFLLFALTASYSAWAITLAPIVIDSAFGEKLDASVEVFNSERLRARDVVLRFYDFRSINTRISQKDILSRNSLNYKIVRGSNRNLVIKFSSRREILDKRISFALEATDRIGRSDKRRYINTIAGTLTAGSDGGVKRQRLDRKTLRANEGKFYELGYAAPGTVVSSSDYENLWDIAMQVKAGYGVSVYQVMLAIFQSNPLAFAEGNINTLLAGSEILIPSLNAIGGIDQRASIVEVAKMNYNTAGLPIDFTVLKDFIELVEVADIVETYPSLEEVVDVGTSIEDLPSWVDDSVETTVTAPTIPKPDVQAPVEAPVQAFVPPTVTPAAPTGGAGPTGGLDITLIGSALAGLILIAGIFFIARRGRKGKNQVAYNDGEAGEDIVLTDSDKLDLAEGYIRMNRGDEAAAILKEVKRSRTASSDDISRAEAINSELDRS